MLPVAFVRSSNRPAAAIVLCHKPGLPSGSGSRSIPGVNRGPGARTSRLP